MIPQKLYGITGHPLGQTMSPLLHNWAFAEHDIEAAYMAFPVTPERLADFITSVRTLPLSGVSVTIPHKEAVMAHLDQISVRAQTAGAVNTLYWDNGKLSGDNTDIAGFLAPLQTQAALRTFSCALLLGAGGAAKAVLAGLQELGVPDIVVANRRHERAETLADEFAVKTVPWEARNTVGADLIINATPLGMYGANVQESPFNEKDFRACAQHGTAYDLVYNPLQTRFLAEAVQAGWQTIDGLHMFCGQGIEQFRIWTGIQLSDTAVRHCIANNLR